MELEYAIKVRQFVPGDMNRVREIEKASIEYVTPLSSLLHFYEVPSEGFLVAEVENMVVGYVVGNMLTSQEGHKEGHILDIAVDPAYRKRGVGTTLMMRIMEMFRARGASKVRLEVRVSNMGARKFYSRLGFKEVHIAKRYYRMRGYTEDAVFMIKSFET